MTFQEKKVRAILVRLLPQIAHTREAILAYVGRFGHLLNTYPVSRAISLPLVIGLCETGGSRPPCNPTQFPLEDPSHDSLVSFYT